MTPLMTLALVIVAQAQTGGVVATARGAPPPPQESTATSAPARIDDHPDGELVQVVKVGPCTPYGAEIAAEARAEGARVELDRAPHGEIGAGVGTGGAREVHGVVCQPIGPNSSVTVSAGSFRGPRGGW